MGFKARNKSVHHIKLVRSVAGLSVYMNGYRIAGNKPWGGGTVIRTYELSDSDLRRAEGMVSRDGN